MLGCLLITYVCPLSSAFMRAIHALSANSHHSNSSARLFKQLINSTVSQELHKPGPYVCCREGSGITTNTYAIK